jgi:twitching motility protein PilT
MRQDPDVIMIGELRDLETVKAAIDAANTGHLVLGTLHTMSASQTIDRALSFFPAEDKEWAAQVLASVLIGVMSQVLVPGTNGGRVLSYELMINTLQVRNHIQSRNLKNIFNEMDTGSSMGHVLLNRNLEEHVRAGRISEEDAVFAAYDPAKLSFWSKLRDR